MKKTFSAFLVFLLLLLAFANAKAITYPPFNPTPDPTDTVPYVINDDELTHLNDSLSTSPAYDLYSEFDTDVIHYTKFNIESLKDSIKTLTLCGANNCEYVHPFLGKVTCPFGRCKRYFHYGVDIDLETGDPVVAAFDGKVRIAKKNSSYGNVVVIRHSNGLETYYAHLSKLKVEVGQEVFAGDVIGLGGNTGYSRGSHLHFEVRYLGQPVNPMDVISFTDHKLLSNTLEISKKTFVYYPKGKKPVANANAYVSNGGKLLPGNIYVVKSGDSLSAIARRYGTTIDVLCKKNGIKTTTVLQLGQKIKV
jgi:Peptidase family M23/LysM domain